MKKIGKFFKSIWANKNSILAILSSVACICLAIWVVLGEAIIGFSGLKWFKQVIPEVQAVEAVEAVEYQPAINVGDVLVPAVIAGEQDVREAVEAINIGDVLVPAVLAGEEDVRAAVEAINIGDVLVPAVIAGEADVREAVYATQEDVDGGLATEVGQLLQPAINLGDILVPEVLAGEGDVREAVEAINIGDILVPAVLAGEEDVREAVEAIHIGDILVPEVLAGEEDVRAEVLAVEAVEAVEYQPERVVLNIYGYCLLGLLTLIIAGLDIFGIVNHYGWEGWEVFAARLEARKQEVESKLVSKEQKEEYAKKLAIFKKGLKELSSKIEAGSKKISELKTLIDNNLATTEQVINYNSLNAELSSLKNLQAEYTSKISDIKQVL